MIMDKTRFKRKLGEYLKDELGAHKEYLHMAQQFPKGSEHYNIFVDMSVDEWAHSEKVKEMIKDLENQE